MRKALLGLLALGVAAVGADATTRTVAQDGSGDFTSIQAAIDAFTEAERTDGEPDEVVIMDSATYDEQVVLGGLPPAEGASAGYLDDIIAFNQTTDHFTLRGNDPDNRPVVFPTTVDPVAYGVFTGDATDNFVAVLSFLLQNATVANIEFRTDGSIHDEIYGANGQAGNVEFNNVLFGRMGDSQAGDSLVNLNNDVTLTDDGFNNNVTFNNCTWDGTVGDENYDASGVYFHGWDLEGMDPEVAEVNITFDGCSFINTAEATYIRGDEQANHITVTNNYMTGVNNGFQASGQGSFTIEDSIFYQNTNSPGEFAQDHAVIKTVGRGGFTPELTVRNNLFVENLDPFEFEDATGFQTSASVIRIQNDGDDQLVTIENNTFVDNPLVIRFADSEAREREAVINNNIFQNAEVVLTASDGDNVSYLPPADDTGAPTLTVNGEGNIFDNVVTVVEEQEFLPNVSLEGTEEAVTFENPSINPDAPFEGPPYIPVDTTAGANLSDTSIDQFILY